MPGRNDRLPGAGSAQAGTHVLPNGRSICARPSAEPIQSPSGCSWAINRMRCAGSIMAIASRTSSGFNCAASPCASSLMSASFIDRLLASHFPDEIEDARTLLDGMIEFEHDFRGVAQIEAAGKSGGREAGGLWQGPHLPF